MVWSRRPVVGLECSTSRFSEVWRVAHHPQALETEMREHASSTGCPERRLVRGWGRALREYSTTVARLAEHGLAGGMEEYERLRGQSENYQTGSGCSEACSGAVVQHRTEHGC